MTMLALPKRAPALDIPSAGAVTDAELHSIVEQAWRASWDRFHHDGTHLFYDFVCSHNPAKRWAGLPSPDEARRAYPNQIGRAHV